MTGRRLEIGIVGAGIVIDADRELDIDTRFRLAAESGAFDYYDRTPPPAEIDAWRRASERHGLPIRAGGFYYVLGRDEPLLEWHLRIGAALGARVHNVQFMTAGVDGRPVSDEAVARAYLDALETGARLGIDPCLEVHVNMWSEHFGRIERVARIVQAAGAPFRMTLDHSHVIFKIDNPEEQDVQGMRAAVESGEVVLDPAVPGNVCSRWIEAGWVRHAHARPAVPANPRNVWARHPDGTVGRGIQYPFIEPGPGQWHSPWDERRLEPWKRVVRMLMDHHAAHDDSPLGQISCEMIPFPDYGGGARYSIFEHNVALAKWLREEWRVRAGR